MADKGKEKKVEVRDVVRNQLAQLIMVDRGLETISRTKEGLVIEEVNDKGEKVHLVVRVIQKKELVEKADIVETLNFRKMEDEAIQEVEALEAAEAGE